MNELVKQALINAYLIFVCVLMFAILVAVEVYFFHSYFKRRSSQKNAPLFTTQATVFSKAMNNGRYGSSYFIAFTFPDGCRKNIPVDVGQYNTIGEGEDGILTYRQDAKYIWFVSFQRTA